MSADRGKAAREALQAWKPRSELIADCWRTGTRNIRELARLANVDRNTVYRALETEGIDWRNRGTPVEGEEP